MTDTPYEEWIEREGYRAGAEDGYRAGRLALALQWPEFRRTDYAMRAYRLGIERGRLEAARELPAAVIVVHQAAGRRRVRLVADALAEAL